jgi:hypothetical protein
MSSLTGNVSKVFKQNAKDEFYTPKILVDIIQPFVHKLYIKYKKAVIWLPFDTEQSEFAYMCREQGYNYIASHTVTRKDFFSWEPEEWSFAVSNPPFSKKLAVFKRLNRFKKPWAMLCNIMCLNYMEIGNYFADHPCQILVPDKRVSFDGNASSFCSGYFCNNFLDKDLIFCHIKNKNSGKDFIPSRMSGCLGERKTEPGLFRHENPVQFDDNYNG